MTNLTGKNYREQAEQAEQPVILSFYSPHCKSCGRLAPELKELSQQVSSRMKFCTVNVDEEESLAQQFDILGVPTLILLENGEVMQRICGRHSREELTEILNLD